MIILILSLFLAIFLTGKIRRYAIHKSLIDIPNQRSSHDRPIPRGGGLVIVIISLFAVLLAGFSNQLVQPEMLALLGAGSLIATIGWLDDHRDLSAFTRVSIHFIAAIWIVFCLSGLTEIELGLFTMQLSWFGSILAVLGIVWLINLYNFMDGTDGIAAIQTLSAGSFAVIFFVSEGQIGLAQILWATIGASLGFLFWNWSPAKIFMGDVGSSYLGCFFASYAMIGEKSSSVPILVWSILLALFFWDATLTLIRRFLAGEKWYAAHRSHAYQRLVQMGYSHSKLALSFLAVNILIIWPIAWCAISYPASLLPLAIVVMIMSIALWLAIQSKYDEYQQ